MGENTARKEKERKLISGIASFIMPEGSDIQVSAFIILALCGIIVCVITAFVNLIVGFGVGAFLESAVGAVISSGLLFYTKKTGNYKLAMILTILIIFIGLFTFLFFSGGGYHSGMPCFFIFAVVFTAFLLDGIIMPVFVLIEIVWYALICLYVYYNPGSVVPVQGEESLLTDILVDEIIVSISLAITMYFQIRVYRKKQLELNEAILEAEEANRAKSDFLGKMSHDIRTPLNTIMAMNELIVSNTSSSNIREWVSDSNVSGQILISLIDDMLDLTKIEAGGIKLLSEPWDTREVFDETAKVWKLNAERKGLDFWYELDKGVPEYLKGDETSIRKIMNNLLSNAVKYTKEGSVRLNVRMDKELEITVSDTGVGIAPEYLKTIFKPFERGTQDIYRETSGSGLGLAIVYELVEAMGGKINCVSAPGEGAIFSLKLPQEIYKGTGKQGRKIEAVTEKGSGTTDQFMAPDARILVVDDNPYNRKVIERFLEPLLIQTDDVESGSEALEMIDIKKYDLILMDLRMPVMDGVETLKKIREEYPDFDSPVVVLTADIMNGVEERLLNEGFSSFLAKPVSSAALYRTIARFIPDKVIPVSTSGGKEEYQESVEKYQDILMPYGIDIRLALENNAGSREEFLFRAEMFEKYSDENLKRLTDPESREDYYLEIHSVKSIARGVGAFLLANLSETVEYRKNEDFEKEMNPVIIGEYDRVRKGLKLLREEAS